MAFHSYTQLIQKLFNAYWCGPPYRVTGTSPWPSVDHSVSRLPPPTLRPVQARFHCGSARHRAPPRRRRQLVGSLCKRHAVTPEGAPTACGRTVSGTISLPWKGCFSPFPHGTRSLSVSREYLALPDGPGRFAQGSTCPALLRMPMGPVGLRVQDSHRLRSDFPDAFRSPQGCHHMVLLPRGRAKSTRPGLGCSPVARHYWGNHCCFLFLRVLRCFSSPRWPRHRKCRWQAFSLPGCPIRIPADQRSFAPTRGLSQLIASFVASVSQGIHRAPFATFTDAPYPKTGKARSYFQLCHTPANIVRGTTLIRVLFSTVSLCRNMSKIVLWATTVSWRGLAERPSLVPNWCRGADWLNAHPFPTWVENNGFEPLTPCLQSRCSSQLS